MFFLSFFSFTARLLASNNGNLTKEVGEPRASRTRGSFGPQVGSEKRR
jgi:hypothetical protein